MNTDAHQERKQVPSQKHQAVIPLQTTPATIGRVLPNSKASGHAVTPQGIIIPSPSPIYAATHTGYRYIRPALRWISSTLQGTTPEIKRKEIRMKNRTKRCSLAGTRMAVCTHTNGPREQITPTPPSKLAHLRTFHTALMPSSQKFCPTWNTEREKGFQLSSPAKLRTKGFSGALANIRPSSSSVCRHRMPHRSKAL